MRIAVMQPYIFPYIGYFQLVEAADIFVFYDDVNYIKSGWINRNKLLVQGKASTFTVPLASPSSFKTIRETEINRQLYPKWFRKFTNTVQQSYGKAPNYEEVMPLLLEVMSEPASSIADVAAESITAVCGYLGLTTEFRTSSKSFAGSKGMDRADRLVRIVHESKGSTYINPAGGSELYTKEFFEQHGIELQFLHAGVDAYTQFKNEPIKGLSIIDVLMFNERDKVLELLNAYQLA